MERRFDLSEAIFLFMLDKFTDTNWYKRFDKRFDTKKVQIKF